MSEIEIKFVTKSDAIDAFKHQILPLLEAQGASISAPVEKRLQNDYYDTPEHLFEKQKIGFRVRGADGKYEQTVKTNGKVTGGLHERAEYNIPLLQNEPDLTLFDAEIWPENWSSEDINAKLTRQFSTHFTRTAFIVTIDKSKIELVFDAGEALTDKASSPIQEIELELIEGQVHALFVLATLMLGHIPMRLSDVSKAARGYQLLHGTAQKVSMLPELLATRTEETTEQTFEAAMLCALNHWQHHEHLFLETKSVKMLGEVATGIRMLQQTVSLFLGELDCSEMQALQRQLASFEKRWRWQEDLQSLRYLMSKKSVFNKGLSKHPSLISYLQGRQAGLLQAHAPQKLFFAAESTRIKLVVIEILASKPWQKSSANYAKPVMVHAQDWLSQGWQSMQQCMPDSKTMHSVDYIATEPKLSQALHAGFILANLFAGARGQYRAPWLDIMAGIDELKALRMLQKTLKEAELEAHEELSQWADEKVTTLLKVMERSRQVAIHADVYW